MRTAQGSRRDFKGLEKRRLTAARLFAAGKLTDAEIARRVGVSRQSVLRWARAWRKGGRTALRAAGRAGRKPRLAPEQLACLEAALRAGPRAYGFPTNLWTLPRVARLIQQLTGVQYHPGHVWRLLGALDWTLQRPATRARERNDAAIEAWKAARWPAGNKTLADAAPGSSSKTKAASPSDRRSAARGRPAAKRPS